MKKYGIFFIYIIILNFTKVIELDLNQTYSYFVAFVRGYSDKSHHCVEGLIEYRDKILEVFEEYMKEGGNLKQMMVKKLGAMESAELDSYCKFQDLGNLLENLKKYDYLKQKLKLLGQSLSNTTIIDWTVD